MLRKELADAGRRCSRSRYGGRARLAQEQLEREREARVQHLANVLRRIRRWAWLVAGRLARSVGGVHGKRMLAGSAQRLARRACCVLVHWQNDWEAEILAKRRCLRRRDGRKDGGGVGGEGRLAAQIGRLKQQLAKALEGVQGATNDAQQLQKQLEAESKSV